MATCFSILAWKTLWTEEPGDGVAKSWTWLCMHSCVYVNPKLLIYLSPLCPAILFGNHKFFCVCLWVYFCFVNKLICVIFVGSTCKSCHMILVFLSLIYFSSLGPPMLLQIALFHSFLWLSNTPMYIFIYHIFFIHSSVNGPLGNFHVLTFVNTSVMNIRVCVPFQIRVFSRHMPREAGFLGHMAILISGFFFFKESPYCSS